MTDAKRLIDLLAATDDFFKSKGIESPRRNAEALFAKALNVPRIELYLQHDRPLKDDELAQLRDLIRQRAKRIPLQYLVGKVEFCSAQITLKPGLLIPRPETEEIVAALLAHIPDRARVLDIGCGTGCISVSIALKRHDCMVVAVDIDRDAAELTLENAVLNGVDDRVKVLTADMFADTFGDTVGENFDVIISNPPYLRQDELADLEPEVREYERPQALVAGPEGDECHIRIANLLPAILKAGGVFALEFGQGQSARVSALFRSKLTKFEIHRDMQGTERYLIGWR